MKGKRIIAVVTAALLFVAMASACNKQGGDSIASNKNLDLTIWYAQGNDYVSPKMPAKLEDRIPENWLYQKTGVKVKDVYGNGGNQWEAKLSQLIAGNNLPSMLVVGGGQGPAHFNVLREGDLIHELTPEMLQTYAPNVLKSIPQDAWDAIKIDGKIYGIPYSIPVSKERTPGFTDEQYNYIIVSTILKAKPTTRIIAIVKNAS